MNLPTDMSKDADQDQFLDQGPLDLPVALPKLLSNHFHKLVLGHDYLAVLLALKHANDGHRVAFVGDDRFQFNPQTLRWIGQLEMSMLIKFGELYQILPFQNLSQYLTPIKECYMLDSRQIILGGMPSENILEIKRKIFPHFDQVFAEISFETINQEIDQLYLNLAETSFKFYNYENFNETFFEQNVPPYIKKWVEKIRDEFFNFSQGKLEHSNLEEGHLRYWVTFFQGHYQDKCSDEISLIEIYHLVLSLIGQRFEVHVKKLFDDLKVALTEQHAEVFEDKVDQFLIENRQLESLELKSLQGVVAAKHIAVIGNRFPDHLFTLKSKHEHYRGLSFDWPFEFIDKSYRRIISLSVDDMGSVHSYIEFWQGQPPPLQNAQIKANNSHPARACLYTRLSHNRSGRELDYVHNHEESVLKRVEKLCYLFQDEQGKILIGPPPIAHLSFEDNFKLAPIEHFNLKKLGQNLVHKFKGAKYLRRNQYQVWGKSSDGQKSTVNNVHVLSPFEGHSLGLFGVLLQVKNSSL